MLALVPVVAQVEVLLVDSPSVVVPETLVSESLSLLPAERVVLVDPLTAPEPSPVNPVVPVGLVWLPLVVVVLVADHHHLVLVR